MKLSYRHQSQNLLTKMQGVHGQWKRDYCMEQERRLLRQRHQHQRVAS